MTFHQTRPGALMPMPTGIPLSSRWQNLKRQVYQAFAGSRVATLQIEAQHCFDDIWATLSDLWLWPPDLD